MKENLMDGKYIVAKESSEFGGRHFLIGPYETEEERVSVAKDHLDDDFGMGDEIICKLDIEDGSPSVISFTQEELEIK